VVQSAGFAFRIRADILVRDFGNSGALRELVLLYTQALITQIAQTAMCNRYHAIEQQLCRWLLLSLDRLTSSESYGVKSYGVRVKESYGVKVMGSE
jgi:hypothetical protein